MLCEEVHLVQQCLMSRFHFRPQATLQDPNPFLASTRATLRPTELADEAPCRTTRELGCSEEESGGVREGVSPAAAPLVPSR